MSDWITSRPGVLDGKPCVRGTRISVEFILEALAGGASQAEILKAYPQLTGESLSAALRYAAEVLEHEVIWKAKDSA